MIKTVAIMTALVGLGFTATANTLPPTPEAPASIAQH